MNENASNTWIEKAETLSFNLLWNKPISETDCYSTHAKPINENFSNMQLKSRWNNIDWKTVETHVNRLQVRITKAVIKGKWNLVKRLSYLLTHSFYAKLLAV